MAEPTTKRHFIRAIDNWREDCACGHVGREAASVAGARQSIASGGHDG